MRPERICYYINCLLVGIGSGIIYLDLTAGSGLLAGIAAVFTAVSFVGLTVAFSGTSD